MEPRIAQERFNIMIETLIFGCMTQEVKRSLFTDKKRRFCLSLTPTLTLAIGHVLSLASLCVSCVTNGSLEFDFPRTRHNFATQPATTEIQQAECINKIAERCSLDAHGIFRPDNLEEADETQE